jgi:hypothetical protein
MSAAEVLTAEDAAAIVAEVDAETSAPVVDTWPAEPGPEVYRGLAGDLVRAVADVTEADPIGVLGSILAVFGATVGPGPMCYQGSQQRANVFAVLVGETSSGRKGTATDIGRAPFTAAYPEYNSLLVPGLGSGEGLIARLKPHEDGSVEPRALIFEPEYSRLLAAMGRDGSTISQAIRDAWDGSPMGRFLARESSLVTNHHVGLLGHITPVELRDKLRDTDAASGYGNRHLWIAVRRTRLIPFPVNPAGLVTPYIEALHRAIIEAQPPREYRLSATARDRWETFYAAQAMRKRWGQAGALTARAEAQTVRLALIYALMDRADEIGLSHLEAGIALEAYAERSVLYVFGDSTGNADADSIRRTLRDNADAMTRNDLRAETGIRDGSRMTKALDLLRGLELVTVTRGAADGRRGPRPEYVQSTEAPTHE